MPSQHNRHQLFRNEYIQSSFMLKWVLEFHEQKIVKVKPKPFRHFCCLSNWTSHCTSNVHSHLTM